MVAENLQAFVAAGHMEGVAETVDLSNAGRNLQNRAKPGKPGKGHLKTMNLIMDAECCLDRLYGGFFSGERLISSYLPILELKMSL